MNELIVIQPQRIGNEEVNSIDARDLHSRLGVQKKFADWIKYNITKLNLIDGTDFTTYSQNGEKGRPTEEYIITLDTGKHIAMMTNTPTAHDIRTYFIEFEKRAKALPAIPADPFLAQMEMVKTVYLNQLELKKATDLHSVELADHGKRLDDLKPRLTASSITTVLGAISHTAKIYRQAQTIKHVKVSVPEATEYFRLLLHDRFQVSDIGYLSDIKAACKFLQAEAKKYQVIIDAWIDRNSLFTKLS